MAVALPIYKATESRWKAVVLGTLSGLTEPLGGLVGYLVSCVLPSHQSSLRHPPPSIGWMDFIRSARPDNFSSPPGGDQHRNELAGLRPAFRHCGWNDGKTCVCVCGALNRNGNYWELLWFVDFVILLAFPRAEQVYISIEELLPLALKYDAENKLASKMFFLGMLVIGLSLVLFTI